MDLDRITGLAAIARLGGVLLSDKQWRNRNRIRKRRRRGAGHLARAAAHAKTPSADLACEQERGNLPEKSRQPLLRKSF